MGESPSGEAFLGRWQHETRMGRRGRNPDLDAHGHSNGLYRGLQRDWKSLWESSFLTDEKNEGPRARAFTQGHSKLGSVWQNLRRTYLPCPYFSHCLSSPTRMATMTCSALLFILDHNPCRETGQGSPAVSPRTYPPSPASAFSVMKWGTP